MKVLNDTAGIVDAERNSMICNFVPIDQTISGLFIMVEIAVASAAAVFSVFVMHMHSNSVKRIPVPRWLLLLTCVPRKKAKTKNITSTQQVSK